MSTRFHSRPEDNHAIHQGHGKQHPCALPRLTKRRAETRFENGFLVRESHVQARIPSMPEGIQAVSSSDLIGASFSTPGPSSGLPDRRILLAVLEVIFRFNQFQRLLPYFLSLYFFIQLPQILNDVVAD